MPKLFSYSSASSIDGTEMVPVLKGGVNKKTTVASFLAPVGWGQWWQAALSGASAAPAVAAIVADSVGRGFFANPLLANGWAGQIKATLQGLYGDGGSGFQGVIDTLIQSAVMTNYVSEQVVTSTAGGLWTAGVTRDGPGATVVYNNAPGATTAFSGVRGTTIRMFLLRAAAIGAPFTYSIDGAGAVASTTLGANGILEVVVNGLSAGPHTVVITHTGNSAQYLNVLAVCGQNSTGVRFDNYGLQGATSAYFAPAAPTYGAPADWSGGPSNPADLVIYSLGLNDANANVTAATYLANVETFLSRVRTGTGGKRGKVDLLILAPHLGSWGTSALYSSYVNGLRSLAESYGAALVNIWAQGMNSYSLWSDLGYWSDGTNSGIAGNDLVHPRTQGHSVIAASLATLLVPTS